MSETTATNSTISRKNIQRVLEFLKEGTSQVNLARYEKVVLVLGPTGSGKTTLTNFLADTKNRLESRVNLEGANGDVEYIITDEADKIRKPDSFMSKTIVPELIYDQDSNTAYIDCPGFNDNRNEAYDIAEAYFIRKVFHDFKNVKILLVISHSWIGSNTDRDNLLHLLQHVSVLLRDIENYTQSIAMVATKVDNKTKKNSNELISDESVIKGIAQTLKSAKKSIEEEQGGYEVYGSHHAETRKDLYYRNAPKLIDSLIRQNDKKGYEKLAIFRRPDREGMLKTIPALQNEKNALKSVIQGLQYTSVDDSSIGYTLSEKSRLVIQYLETEIGEIIANDIDLVGKIIIGYYSRLESNMIQDDMYALLDILKNVASFLDHLRYTVNSANSDLASEYRTFLNSFCKRKAQDVLDEMARLGNFLTFLRKMAGKKLDTFVWKWQKKLDEGAGHFVNSVKWYEFLAALHESLSRYEVQKNPAVYLLPTMDGFEGALRNCTKLKSFLDSIHDPDLFKRISSEDIEKIVVDGSKLRYFDKVIEATLKNTLTYRTFDSGTRLQVSGDYVKVSELIENSMYRSSKSVEILARHTVFIDANLTKENDITIIAPRWDIVGPRRIKLDGSFGPYHFSEPSTDPLFFIRNIFGQHHKMYRTLYEYWSCEGCKGRDGAPGNPGQSAGHFLGVGLDFKNLAGLLISAVGGAGGNGQHGGDGAKGKDGVSAKYYICDLFSTSEKMYKCGKPLYCPKDVSCTIGFSHEDTSDLIVDGIRGQTDIAMDASEGKSGGDCGFGGAAGLGGYAGTVEMINLGSENITVTTRVANGKDGLFGLHGRVGEPGAGGESYHTSYVFQDAKPLTKSDSYSLGFKKAGGRGKCGDSDHPTYSYSKFNNDLLNWSKNKGTTNVSDRKAPVQKNILYDFPRVMADFKNLLLENVFNCVKKKYSLDFYTILHQNENILKNDTSRGIFAEIEHLQSRHHEFNPEINRKLYTSLKDRIQKIHRNGARQHEELLDFMSLTIASKLARFGPTRLPQLISDQPTYFDLLKTADVGEIWKYFAGVIGDQISEPESALIEMIDTNLAKKMEQTASKIFKLSDQSDEKKLSTLLLNQKLFSSFKAITNFLGLCKSVATSNAELITGMKITEVLPSVKLSFPSMDGIEILRKIGAIEEILQKKLEIAKLALSLRLKELMSLETNHDHSINRLLERKEMLQAYKTVVNKSYNYPVFSNTSEVIQKIDNIDFENLIDSDEGDEAREIMKKLQNNFKLIDFEADLYHEMVMSNIKPDFLISTIDNLQEKIAFFNDLHIEIFQVIKPPLVAVRESFKGNLYQPEDIATLRSLISVALIKMKSLLGDTIKKLETDFSAQNQKLLTEDLDEITTLLLHTYQGSLPIYQDRTFLYNLHLYFEKKESESGVYKKLENPAKEDLLRYEYESLVGIYQKLVFPFDILIPENFSLPTNLPRLSSTESGNSIITIIEMMESKLRALDNFRSSDELYFATSSSTEPFFIWKHHQYEDKIKKLLRGERVAMKATIGKTSAEFLTFKNIGIRLKLNNSTQQEELNDQLRNFYLTMTHSGNSHFNLCEHIYAYSQPATYLTHKFDDTGSSNEAEEGTSKHGTMLSPYTTWIMEMTSIDNGVSFKPLESFGKFEIDIELFGEGKFISLKNESFCVGLENGGEEEYLSENFNDDTSRTKKKRFSFIGSFVDSVGKTIGNVATTVGNTVTNVANGAANAAVDVGNAVGNVATGVVNVGSDVGKAVGNTATGVVNGAAQLGKGVVNVVNEAAKVGSKVGETVINGIDELGSKLGVFNPVQKLPPSVVPFPLPGIPDPWPGIPDLSPCHTKSNPAFDLNAVLLLTEYATHRISGTKLYDSTDMSPTPAQARITALEIIIEIKSKFTAQQWQFVDPIRLMSELERNIIDGDTAAIRRTISNFVDGINAQIKRFCDGY